MTFARVHSIQVSDGGVPKLPLAEARIGPDGVDGDRQRDLQHHGGPERAVSLLAFEVIQALRAEGHPVEPGGTGENVTVAGLLWEEVVPGLRLQVGEAVLEITRFVTPCRKIAACFRDGAFERILHERHPGSSRVYARVLATGTVRPGDPVRVVGAAPSGR